MPKKSKTPSLADASAAIGGAAAVDRALSLLSAFRSGDDGLTLAELAQRTGLYKSTALRLLASLLHAHLLQQLPDGRYALGMEVARLHNIYASSFSLDRLVLPVLQQLVDETGEGAAYHVVQGSGAQAIRVCLYRIDSPQPVRDHIKAGDVLPLNKGTGARVLLAFGAVDLAAIKITTKDRQQMAKVREQGYCAEVGDRLAQVAGISAPVFKDQDDGRQMAIAAVTLTMPAHRFDERMIKPVLEASRLLSARV